MNRSAGYVREYKSIDKEIKRLSENLKSLRKQKGIVGNKIYHIMNEYHLGEIDGIKKKQLTPKTPVVRKKLKDKKNDAIHLFHQYGIPNPEEFWNELQDTQKVVVNDTEDDVDYEDDSGRVGTKYRGVPKGFEEYYD